MTEENNVQATEEIGITNVMEILSAIELLSVSGVKIAKDGIGLDDLSELINVLKNYNMLKAAVEGAKESFKELSNLDQAEALQIVGKVYAIINGIKNA